MFVSYSLVLLFADYIFDGGTIVTKMSALDCAALCVHTRGCSSVFYNRNLGSCMLSATRHVDTSKVTPRAGYGYFRLPPGFDSKCLTTANCRYKNALCREAACECKMGFSYDSQKESCVKKCSTYGDSYATYQDRSTEGFNSKTYRVSNPKDCIKACVKETSFVCISAEYNPLTTKCNLNRVAWFDLPNSATQVERNWVTLYRHCAI